jgi:hypothetical protein
VNGQARVLLGACDDLLAPRTLGPLHDVVGSARAGPLAAALRSSRDAVLNAVQKELSDPHRPTVLVVEDAHWADEATLDVLRFVGAASSTCPRCCWSPTAMTRWARSCCNACWAG